MIEGEKIICQWCHKEFKRRPFQTKPKFCSVNHCQKYSHIRDKIKAEFSYDASKIAVELKRLSELGRAYANFDLIDNKLVYCLWCKNQLKGFFMRHPRQKFCCCECRESYNKMLQKIYKFYFFQTDKQISEESKLESKGFRYQLPKEEA